MKKLCKLFYEEGAIGKWILYDLSTDLVIEIKKFKKNGEETPVNLVEAAMLNEGDLKLEHCIKMWETELALSKMPTIPDLATPSWDLYDGNTMIGGDYVTSTSTSNDLDDGSGDYNFVSPTSGISYIVSDLVPQDTIYILPSHQKFLASIGQLSFSIDTMKSSGD